MKGYMLKIFFGSSRSWLILLSGFLLGFTSCLSEDDTPPEVEAGSFKLLIYNEVDSAFNIDITDGGSITLPASFVVQSNITDDVLIDRLEVNINPLDTTEEEEGIVSIFPWSITDDEVLELPVKGSAVNVFREIEVPNSAESGEYEFSMKVFDEQGNVSPEDFRTTFLIINNSPKIIITEPAQEFESYLTGDTLKVKGNILSENMLRSSSVSLGAGDFFETISLDSTENISEIDTFFILTDTIGVGFRTLRTRVTDEEENSGSLDIKVQIE